MVGFFLFMQVHENHYAKRAGAAGPRLSELLRLRGFPPDPGLVDVLIRGSHLVMSEGRALKMVNGRLEEVSQTGDCELWLGWNWGK